MTKVVYVTGCLGFIGSYVTRACLKKGWHVKGVDKITYASNKSLLGEFKKSPNFSFVHCDINDLKFLYDCDYVINTAGADEEDSLAKTQWKGGSPLALETFLKNKAMFEKLPVNRKTTLFENGMLDENNIRDEIK